MKTIVFVALTMVTLVTANLNAQEKEKRFGFKGTFQYSFLPVKVK